MTERWKETAAPGYFVSTYGRVRHGQRPMTPELLHNGYLRVRLGRNRRARIHLLVLEAFIGPCPPRHTAAHGDGDRTNNRLSNLLWKTRDGQLADRVRHGTSSSGLRVGRPTLTSQDVHEIRRLLKDGKPAPQIAPLYGVHAQAIRDIASGRTWRNISEEEIA